MDSINYSLNRYILMISYFSFISASCFPEMYSPGGPEISPMKCLYTYITSRWKPEESKTKELEPVEKPVKTKSEICPVNKPTIGPPNPIHENKHKEATTSSYKTTDGKNEKKKRLGSAFTSVGKKENSELDNSKTQAEEARHSSFDTYMNWKPVEGNWTTFGLHLEIPFTDKTFMQICAVQIAFILILMAGQYYYMSELRSIQKSVNETMASAQAVAHSTVEDFRSSQRYPESNEEAEPIPRNDELALMTLSSMVYCHLQNLANEIIKSKPEENLEKYLTEDFLQMIAARIAQDDVMKFEFQKLLPAKTLLQLGQLNYQRIRNSGKSEQFSSDLESSETVAQRHCTGKSNCQDVKVNIGVQVGGQEIKIPHSKTEKREENSSD